MKKKKKSREAHEFSAIPGFDQAVKKIAGIPRQEVERREAAFRKRRKPKK
jgi:hypothetical protein